MTTEIIHHTRFTCDECGGEETQTKVLPDETFSSQRDMPDSMTTIWVGFGKVNSNSDALLHKTCIRLWLSKISIP